MSFSGALDIGRFGEPDITEDPVLHVASLDNLMALKAQVILQRAQARGYSDLPDLDDTKIGVATRPA